MIQETLLLVVMIGFSFACGVIDKIIQEEIRQMNSLNSNDSMTSMQLGILSSRKSSLNNMWLIVITMLFCATFDFIYSLSVFVYYSPSCTP